MSYPARFSALPPHLHREVDSLISTHGMPIEESVDLGSNSYLDQRKLENRPGEVCIVLRRPNTRLLIFRKTFYPPGVYRLLTGGINANERIMDALTRETWEETGLETAVRRFLAAVAYTVRGEVAPVFHTFAFLVDEVGGTLGAIDPHEHVEEFLEIEVPQLLTIADDLDRLQPDHADELNSPWSDWGAFRAVIHRVVWAALQPSTQPTRPS